MGRCEIVWDEGFSFLVKTPCRAKITVAMMSKRMEGNRRERADKRIGIVEMSLDEVLEVGKEVKGCREMRLSHRLQETEIILDITVRVSFFRAGDIDFPAAGGVGELEGPVEFPAPQCSPDL